MMFWGIFPEQICCRETCLILRSVRYMQISKEIALNFGHLTYFTQECYYVAVYTTYFACEQGRGVHVTGVSAAYTFKLNKNILSE
jgi:hypothetical protein